MAVAVPFFNDGDNDDDNNDEYLLFTEHSLHSQPCV